MLLSVVSVYSSTGNCFFPAAASQRVVWYVSLLKLEKVNQMITFSLFDKGLSWVKKIDHYMTMLLLVSDSYTVEQR